MKISASIYEFSEPSKTSSSRDLWQDLCNAVASKYSCYYRLQPKMHFKIFLKDKNVVSPTNVLIRSRVLMGSIRRSAGKPALLDISVGNHFSVIGSDFEAIETSAFIRTLAPCMNLLHTHRVSTLSLFYFQIIHLNLYHF